MDVNAAAVTQTPPLETYDASECRVNAVDPADIHLSGL
jgi:hypothetical protein